MDSNRIIAREKTLAIPELFEMILTLTDYRTLLRAQRVSRWWRDAIRGSKNLQKKLFFLPATIEEVIALDMIEIDSIVAIDEYGGVCTMLNAGLYRPFGAAEPSLGGDGNHRYLVAYPRSPDYDKQKQASWRRMLPTAGKLPDHLEFDYSSPMNASLDFDGQLEGFRMGELVDRAQTMGREAGHPRKDWCCLSFYFLADISATWVRYSDFVEQSNKDRQGRRVGSELNESDDDTEDIERVSSDENVSVDSEGDTEEDIEGESAHEA